MLRSLNPDAGDFQSGDLLFAKTPGRLIPFGGAEDEADPVKLWRDGTSSIILDLRKLATRNYADEALLRHLESEQSSYQAFVHAYETGGTLPESQQTPFSGSVEGRALDPKEHSGHVAIVEVGDNGEKNVIEAISPRVTRTSLKSWLSKRAKERIWQKQHNGSLISRNQIALAAAKYVNQPYSLGLTRASYSLLDTRDFYCSKLIWLAVRQSGNLSIDGNPVPERIWPLSPLKVFNSPHLLPVVDQGNYRWC